MKKIILFMLAMLFLNSSWAQEAPPEMFKFQAYIYKPNGNPVEDKTVGVEISIYQTAINGNPVYTEEFTTTTNKNGIINLEVGNGTPTFGIFADIPWATAEFYLKLRVDINGGTNYTNMGTSQLLSVPYALLAKKALSVEGDNDTDPTNEIQTLSLDDNVLSLSDGGEVTLPSLEDFSYYFADRDKDAYGDRWSAVYSPSAPVGYVENENDCDDNDSNVYPGATEICDGIDNNCDGNIDEGVTTTYYADNDGDGSGNIEITTNACTEPDGYVSDNTDCDDTDSLVYPGAIEICDGIDNNCDGEIDEGCNSQIEVVYINPYYTADGFNGFTIQTEIGSVEITTISLYDQLRDQLYPLDFYKESVNSYQTLPYEYGYTGAFDLHLETSNGNTEIINNAIFITTAADESPLQSLSITFNNIISNSTISIEYFNAYNGETPVYLRNTSKLSAIRVLNVTYPNSTTINAEIPSDIEPGEYEVIVLGAGAYITLNVIDSGIDNDEDGFTIGQGDCNDYDPNIYPGATEIIGDNIDQNCDNCDDCYEDLDGDTWGSSTIVTDTNLNCDDPSSSNTASRTGDCNDSVSEINPDSTEIVGDGVDQNCDNCDDCYEDLDGDAWGTSTIISDNDLNCDNTSTPNTASRTDDCNDSNPTVNPSASEICDGLDNDCDGILDNIFVAQFTCSNSFNLGNISGDTDSSSINRYENGNQWYKIVVTEDDSSFLSFPDLKLKCNLIVPPDSNYDLKLYSSCAPNSLLGSSESSGSLSESVSLNWDDEIGTTQDYEVYIHVVYISGNPCKNWQLTISGNE